MAAASSSSIPSYGLTSAGGFNLYDRLNSQWHERALQPFMLIVLAHWGEHLAQATQIYVMGWARPKANGILGLWYPWLITSEVLHYLRSEEHTSELQSLRHLVCRLLLE